MIFLQLEKIDSEILPILKCFFFKHPELFCDSHGIHGTGMVYLSTNLPVLLRFGTKPGYPKPNLRDRLQREAHGPNRGQFLDAKLDQRSVDVLFWLGEVFEDLEIVRRVWK